MGHRGEMVGEWDRLLFFKKFQSPEGSLAAERFNDGIGSEANLEVSIPRRVFSC